MTDAAAAATATAIGSYSGLFLAVDQDVARLLALLVLYLVAVLGFSTTRPR